MKTELKRFKMLVTCKGETIATPPCKSEAFNNKVKFNGHASTNSLSNSVHVLQNKS